MENKILIEAITQPKKAFTVKSLLREIETVGIEKESYKEGYIAMQKKITKFYSDLEKW